MYVSVGVTPSRKISLPSLDMGVQSTAARRLDEEWYLLMPNHILRARDCTMVRYSNDLGVSLERSGFRPYVAEGQIIEWKRRPNVLRDIFDNGKRLAILAHDAIPFDCKLFRWAFIPPAVWKVTPK
jgi:hypothetical protein